MYRTKLNGIKNNFKFTKNVAVRDTVQYLSWNNINEYEVQIQLHTSEHNKQKYVHISFT